MSTQLLTTTNAEVPEYRTHPDMSVSGGCDPKVGRRADAVNVKPLSPSENVQAIRESSLQLMFTQLCKHYF